MTNKSFIGGTKGIKKILETNELLTVYTYLAGVLYHSEPCVVKVLWKSSSKSLESIAFPKGSPMVPFFKNTYSKIRQTGALYRLKQKWKQMEKSSVKSCNENILRPISFKKIVSLIIILLFGIGTTLVILAIESVFNRRTNMNQNKIPDLKGNEE